MRIVLQRVKEARVIIDGRLHSEIGFGLLLLLGVEEDDDQDDVEWLAKKILQMRVFEDHDGKMNLSLENNNGEVLIVSQFTLFASTKKGNRPSFIKAARPEKAEKYYEMFVERLSLSLQEKVKRGVFAADMKVHLINDGPVTIIIDSKMKE